LQPVAKIIRLDRIIEERKLTTGGLRGTALKAYWIVGVIALVVCAVSLPARADSVSYNYSYSLVSGGSSVGTVTGSFTFNSASATLSNATITFSSSLFGNVTLTNTGSKTGYVFMFSGVVGGNLIVYIITVNPLNPNQYSISGSITNLSNGLNAKIYRRTVPEGGDWYAYLLPSLLAVCGGVLLAGRRPRNVAGLQAAG
jgi:hypothetical protein